MGSLQKQKEPLTKETECLAVAEGGKLSQLPGYGRLRRKMNTSTEGGKRVHPLAGPVDTEGRNRTAEWERRYKRGRRKKKVRRGCGKNSHLLIGEGLLKWRGDCSEKIGGGGIMHDVLRNKKRN